MTTDPPRTRLPKYLRLALILAALLLVALVSAGLVLRSFLDVDKLIPQLIAAIGERAGLELSVTEVRSARLRGVELGGLSAEGAAAEGCLTATAETLSIHWQLKPLLARRIVVDRLAVHSPRIEWVATCAHGSASDSAPETASASETVTTSTTEGSDTSGSSTSSLAFEVSELRFEEGEATLRTTRDGPIDMSVSGFTVTLGEISLGGALGESFWQKALGRLEAEQMTSGDLIARDFAGDLAIEQGTMTLAPATLALDQGKVELDLSVDLDAGLASELTVDASIDLDRVVSPERSDDEKTMGRGRMSLLGSAASPDPLALIADGSIDIPEGRLGQDAVTTALAIALSTPDLVDFRYAPTTGRFHIEDGTFRFTEPLVLRAMESTELEGWSLEVAGQAGVDAAVEPTLALTIQALMPRARIDLAEIPRELLDLLEDDQGTIVVPVLLTGTLEQPSVRVDLKTLRQAAGYGARREAKRQVLRGLRRLLESDDEEDGN